MPVIPISELKNTSAVSQLCHSGKGPVQVTKNGYEHMVIVTPQMWEAAEEAMLRDRLYRELARGEHALAIGDVVDYEKDTARLREKYGL